MTNSKLNHRYSHKNIKPDRIYKIDKMAYDMRTLNQNEIEYNRLREVVKSTAYDIASVSIKFYPLDIAHT